LKAHGAPNTSLNILPKMIDGEDEVVYQWSIRGSIRIKKARQCAL
jgi:hypothetical protein